MQLKHKIVALSVTPLLLAVTLICVLVLTQNQRLGEQQAALLESAILSSKRAELKNYVALALRVIEPMRNNLKLPQETLHQQTLAALARLDFGKDNYFFVYDKQGRNLMHPRQPDLVGKSLWDMTDADGFPIVQALVSAATQGDGFQRYRWLKPSTQQTTDKLAYVVMLEPWGWLLGIGLYLEDVDQALQQVRTEVTTGIHTTMMAITSIVLVAVLLVFIAGLALNVREHRLADTKLQTLNRRLLNLQEEERSRVSRELHDGISQLLVSIKFQFELASHQLETGAPAGQISLNRAIQQLGEAIGEIRRISHDLHPSLLDTLGLAAAIGQLTSEFEQRCKLSLDYTNDLGSILLPNTLAVALFRIVQEALTNIERHAQADQVILNLSCVDEGIQLIVEDNGIGFNPKALEQGQEGIGLRNIRDRVEHLSGRFELSSNAKGTQIRVVLPLHEAA